MYFAAAAVGEVEVAIAQVVTPAPMLSSIEAPYPAIQSAITLGGARYTPGTVAYGPVGTPLVLSGKDFGGGGNVLFPVYNQGGAVAGKITSWSESIIFVTVPANAGTGRNLQYSDSVMGQWSFGYDHLNRLTSRFQPRGRILGRTSSYA